jgi:hypothetical protein
MDNKKILILLDDNYDMIILIIKSVIYNLQYDDVKYLTFRTIRISFGLFLDFTSKYRR